MIPNKPARSNAASFPFTSRHVGNVCLGLAAIVLFQVEVTHPWVTLIKPPYVRRHGNPREQRPMALSRHPSFHSATRSIVSVIPPLLGSPGDSGRLLWRPVPRHQLIDALLRPAVDKACQQVGEVGLRIDVIQFARLD